VRNYAGAPTANANNYNVNTMGTFNVAAPGILGNDTDASGDALSAELFSDVQHGTLAMNADGSFSYTPEEGFVGTDSFVYRATDGTNFSLLTAVTIRIGANSEPAPSPSPIPEPTGPCSCDDSDEESSEDSTVPASDPLDGLAIVEGDSGDSSDGFDEVLDDVIEDVIEEDEENTDSVDDFFTTVGSCA
jgi:VCBS repeat-containing protein